MAFLIYALAFASSVTAHGFVKSIVADGVTYQGYNPNFQWANPIPSVPGWSDPKNLANGFINDYSSPDIACHLEATPGKAYATVRAGGTVQLQWTDWPESHKGPMIDYLANCNGECTNVDKTGLLWNKIAEQGLLDNTNVPGKWASDIFVSQGSRWTVTIPSTIAPGNYVLRHETIGLHEGGRVGGAQNYPQCINIKVTGSGTNSLSTGTLYNRLYTSSDPGILVNIYQKLSSYIIPGPALFNGGGSNSGGSSGSTTSTSVTTTLTTKLTSPTTSTSTLTTLRTTTRATSAEISTSTTSLFTTTSTTTTRTGGVTGTFIPNPTGKSRRFVCYEETD